MNQSAKHLIAAALLASFGLAAVAQAPSSPPAAMGHGRHQGMERLDPARMQERMQEFRQARRAKRQAELKETLQLAPAQEGAWTAWTASMRPPANWKRPDRAELGRLPTPERIDRMRALRSERMARQDQRAEATKIFYATLNPIQKRVFDLETARRGQRGGRDSQHVGRRGHHRHHWN